MTTEVNLEQHEIFTKNILRNPSPAVLYELGLKREAGAAISSTGALISMSGKRTGRSPSDKRIVRRPETENDVWWGPINIEQDEDTFKVTRERARDYLNTRDQLYVIDAYAGHDPRYRVAIRIICERAYHALFMSNMLVLPTDEELKTFEPDFTILNAGPFPANWHGEKGRSRTCIALSFETKELVVLGSEYAGEMKKGVFTVMNYLMPKRGFLSMHCSCNEGDDPNDVSIFFGLSGTGKTTLSADPKRKLIGDDEHVWTDDGVFNIEGGCYAKCIDLTEEQEPEIFRAIRFGSVLENVVYDPETRLVDYTDTSITQNTRCSYPLSYIPNAKVPAIANKPKNIIFLTCDAFSVLPPVAKLTPGQAMYHFISGYTAKVAGTEVGIVEPEATFSSCFGAPFLVWHPTVYAELLAKKAKEQNANLWLVNTGWSGGPYGVGKRMSLKYTRAILDAIHDGTLEKADYEQDAVFGLAMPKACANVPSEVLNPKKTWADGAKYDETAKKLAKLFHDNFATYADKASEEILSAAPKL